MALDYLFNGSAPSSVTSTVSSVQGMPDWYQEYLRGIAGKATEVAGQGYTQYPDARLAGFTPDQMSSFDLTRQNIGGWQPYQQGAVGAANQILPTASAFLGAGAQYGSDAVGMAGQAGQQAMQAASNPGAAQYALGAGQQAMQAVGGSNPTWTQNWQSYMSPYTQSVVDEIARLGNRNLQEGALANINDSFIGSGGFGSDRNADMIGRSIRDAQRDITGQQSMALQQGYGQAANIFQSDAARQLQMQGLQGQTALNAGQLGTNALSQLQGLQAQTALNAGQLGANSALQAGSMANAGAQIGAAAADSSAQRMGALGQLQQQMGYQDAGALNAIGGQQQQLQQLGLDTQYNNFLEQRGWNWNTLNNLNSVLRGMQIPTNQTMVSNNPTGGYGASPLQWATALMGLGASNGTGTGTTGGTRT